MLLDLFNDDDINIANNNNTNNDVELEPKCSNSTPPGLSNKGSTCYLNVLFQILYHEKLFKQIIYSIDYTKVKIESYRNIIIGLQKFLYKMDNLNLKTQDLNDILNSFNWMNNEELIEHDYTEAYNKIMEVLDNIIHSYGNNLLYDTFKSLVYGEINNYLKCMHCETIKNNPESFTIIQLFIKTFTKKYNNSLSKCIDFFMNKEILTDDNKVYCDTCDKKSEFEKGINVTDFPVYLRFSLSRFEFDFETLTRNKVNDYCEFPLDLDFCGIKYELMSIVLHKGTPITGHYTCIINVNNLWYLFNDSIVKEINKDCIKDFFGGKGSHNNAYILSYRKVSYDNNLLTVYNNNLNSSIIEHTNNLNNDLIIKRNEICLKKTEIEIFIYKLNDILLPNNKDDCYCYNKVNPDFVNNSYRFLYNSKFTLNELVLKINSNYKDYCFNNISIFSVSFYDNFIINYDYVLYNYIYKKNNIHDKLFKFFKKDKIINLVIMNDIDNFSNLINITGLEHRLINIIINYCDTNDSNIEKNILIQQYNNMDNILSIINNNINNSKIDINSETLFISYYNEYIKLSELLKANKTIDILYNNIIIYVNKDKTDDSNKAVIKVINIYKYTNNFEEILLKNNLNYNDTMTISDIKLLFLNSNNINNYSVYNKIDYKKYSKDNLLLKNIFNSNNTLELLIKDNSISFKKDIKLFKLYYTNEYNYITDHSNNYEKLEIDINYKIKDLYSEVKKIFILGDEIIIKDKNNNLLTKFNANISSIKSDILLVFKNDGSKLETDTIIYLSERDYVNNEFKAPYLFIIKDMKSPVIFNQDIYNYVKKGIYLEQNDIVFAKKYDSYYQKILPENNNIKINNFDLIAYLVIKSDEYYNDDFGNKIKTKNRSKETTKKEEKSFKINI